MELSSARSKLDGVLQTLVEKKDDRFDIYIYIYIFIQFILHNKKDIGEGPDRCLFRL